MCVWHTFHLNTKPNDCTCQFLNSVSYYWLVRCYSTKPMFTRRGKTFGCYVYFSTTRARIMFSLSLVRTQRSSVARREIAILNAAIHICGDETSNWCCWLVVQPSVWETLISERKWNQTWLASSAITWPSSFGNTITHPQCYFTNETKFAFACLFFISSTPDFNSFCVL